MNDNNELNLPIQELSQNFDPYGSKELLAKYCGFKKCPPYVGRNYNWLHGWSPDYMLINPILVTGFEYNPENWCFVAKKTDENYLKIENNYKTAKAIGLNVVYLPEVNTKRIPNSLLVMPVHSVDFTEHKHWKFKEYVNEISNIKHLFDRVTICVHSSCFKKGYWVDDFKAAGFEVIVGIDGIKTNALERLQALMSSFEFVTTNGFGSCLAYASYFGAKPSVYGPFSEYRAEDFINEPLYHKFPEVLKPTIEVFSERILRANFPHLFCFPNEAKLNIEWGMYQVGFENKASPAEIKKMLGWDFKGKLKFYFSFRGMKYLLVQLMPNFIKKIIKSFL